jgi:hypothetical protein
MSTDGMVKVGLHAPDGEFETMWATPVGPDRYRLENSPFYAYRVSWLDVVEARPDETGLPVFARVIAKSGHRTVRVILVPGVDEAPERQRVLDDLVALGCSYEGYNPRYFSIDVPAEADLAAVAAYLTAHGHQWEYVDPTYADLHPDDQDDADPPAG